MVFGMGGGNEMEVVISGDASGLNSALAGAAGRIQTFSKKAAGLGAVMGTAAAGGIAKSVSVARDWNSVQREMTKVTDPETAESLGQAIQDMGQDMPVATNKLGELATEAARFGVEGEENILSFVDVVGKMAAATDVSIDEAGEAFAKLGELTGTPQTELENMGDVINMLGQTSATSAGEIVDSMLRASGTMSQMGSSTSEIAALSASMNEVFPSAQKAGRSLRRLGQEMMDPRRVGALAESLGKTPEEFKKMRDEDPTATMLKLAETMKQNGEGADILRQNLTSFSRQGLVAMSSNLESTRAAMERSNKEYKEGGSLAREFGIEAASTGSQIQILKNRLAEVGVTIGNQFLPYIKQAVIGLQGVVGWFSKFNEQTNGVAAAVALVTTAVTGFLPVLGLLISSIGPVIPVVKALGFAIAGVGAPIAIAVAAIAGLYIAWRDNLYGIRDITMSILTRIRELFNTYIPQARAVVQRVLVKIRQLFQTHAPQLKAIIQRVLVRIRELFQTYLPPIQQFVRNAFAVLKQIFITSMEAIRTTLNTVLNVIRGLWQKHGETIKSIVRRTVDLVVQAFRTFATIVTDVFTVLFANLVAFWNAHGETIKSIVGTFTQVVIELVRTFANLALKAFRWLFNTLEPLIRGTLNALQTFWNNWGNEIITIIDFLSETVLGVIGALLSGLESALKTSLAIIKGDWKGAWNEVSSFFTTTFQGIYKFVKKWFGGFISGIVGWLQQALDKFINWGKNLIGMSVIPDIFGDILSFVTGWFTDFIGDIGGWLGDILGNFTETFGDIYTGVKNKMGDVYENFKGAIGDVATKASNKLGDIAKGFTNTFKGIRDGVNDKMQAAKDFFGDQIGGIEETADEVLENTLGLFNDTFEAVGDVAEDIIGAAQNAAEKAGEALGNAQSAAADAAGAAADAAGSAAGAAADAAGAAGRAAGNYVPGLASGGVVTTPTLAHVAEGGESEAVLPLSTLNTLIQSAARFGATRNGGSGRGSGRPMEIRVTVDADSYRTGRLAGRGFVRELRSHNFD